MELVFFGDRGGKIDITLDKTATLEPQKFEATLRSTTDSERTISISGSNSGSMDSEKTPVRFDSQDSQVSDGELGDNRWPRQNSVCVFISHHPSSCLWVD